MLKLMERAALLGLGVVRKLREDLEDWIDYFVQQGKIERDRCVHTAKGRGLVTKADLEALARKIDALSAEIHKTQGSPPSGSVPPKGGKEHHH